MTTLLDAWYSILPAFSSFDPVTYTMMALIVVGGGLMMPNIASIINATLAALMIFALALFARTALVAQDAATLARADWNDLLAMPVHTLSTYVLVFGVAIAMIYGLRNLATKR